MRSTRSGTLTRRCVLAAVSLLLVAPVLSGGSARADETRESAVAYGSGGWSFLQTAWGGGPADFDEPAFDDATWPVGTAGFGGGERGCYLNANHVSTAWDVNTDLLARKAFELPAGATGVQVSLAIDNDYEVFVNGQQVGVGIHDFCPSFDSVLIDVPASALRSGTNVLAIRAHDRGGSTFLDARVTYVGAPPHQICSLLDASKAHKAGSTVPVRLRVCDGEGANLSAPDVVVHATQLRRVDTVATTEVTDAGEANSPTNDFRYDAELAGHVYNLSTKGLSAGTWELSFTVDGRSDPTYALRFDLRP